MVFFIIKKFQLNIKYKIEFLQCANITKEFRRYFQNVWVNIFPPSSWSSYQREDDILQYGTNNYIERNFRELKEFLNNKSLTIDRLISKVYEYSINMDKEMVIREKPQIMNRPLDDIVLRIKKKSMNFITPIIISY